MKVCTTCKAARPLTEYHKDVTAHGGYKASCKACIRTRRAANRQNERYAKYGLTASEYIAMYDDQDGLCAICDSALDVTNYRIDHCHLTNKVRGILCHSCNVGIGFFKDDIDLLNRAMKYLKGHQ